MKFIKECKRQNLTGTFVYHMNYKCYKKYVHYQKTAQAESPGISAITCESEVSIENSFPSASSTRSNSTPRTSCTPAPDKYKTLCVICGFAYKGTYEKYKTLLCYVWVCLQKVHMRNSVYPKTVVPINFEVQQYFFATTFLPGHVTCRT